MSVPGSATIHLKVVTPLRLLVETDVESVALPSLEGEVGVLPGHRPLFVGIGRGRVRWRSGGEEEAFAVRGGYAQVRLPSSEIRKVHLECRATIGQLGNLDHQNIVIGKAGRKRHMGRRPHNRGTSMNPVDHPMGGGEGRSKGGHHPTSPWGKLSKGGKTRKPKAVSNAFIIRHRKKGPHVG